MTGIDLRDPAAEAPQRTRFEIEPFGTEHIPIEDRKSSPRNLRTILFGSSLTFSVIIMGFLPVTLGLGWWQAASAVVVGSALGSALLAPTGVVAPRTGTNNPVSSGAFFGVGGRLIGTLLEAAASLIFAALSIWTGGAALVGALDRMFAVHSDMIELICYGVISVIVTVVSVFGHGSMVAVQRLMIPTAGICLIAGLFVYGGDFDPSYSGGGYVLGSALNTWVASMLLIASTISSLGPYSGDWTRHISPTTHSDRSIVRALFFGGLFGLGGPFMWGTFIGVCFYSTGLTDGDMVGWLMRTAPLWYVPALVFLGLASGTAQAVINTYGTGLDTSSLIPALSRTRATLVACLAATALVYLGHFYDTIEPSVTNVLTLLANFSVPWIVILVIGHLRNGPVYDTDALQVFNRRETGGRYWYTGGVNAATVGIWGIAATVGVLFAGNTWFTGPGAQLLDGLDIGFVLAGLIAGALYPLVGTIAPARTEGVAA
ncbi:cytosine permease [Nocardia sp. NPDC052254]|uniref:purine-cytosine permease family protein n=1 Tax=Nocardia sp. NPDC052254 TaxID=3155681 RepID=UPI003425F4B9